jgi:hypothetical protein
MSITDKPRAYDIDNSNDVARLFRECAGYLKTCKATHCGTDFEGRRFAIDALSALWDRHARREEVLLKTAQGKSDAEG